MTKIRSQNNLLLYHLTTYLMYFYKPKTKNITEKKNFHLCKSAELSVTLSIHKFLIFFYIKIMFMKLFIV